MTDLKHLFLLFQVLLLPSCCFWELIYLRAMLLTFFTLAIPLALYSTPVPRQWVRDPSASSKLIHSCSLYPLILEAPPTCLVLPHLCALFMLSPLLESFTRVNSYLSFRTRLMLCLLLHRIFLMYPKQNYWLLCLFPRWCLLTLHCGFLFIQQSRLVWGHEPCLYICSAKHSRCSRNFFFEWIC